jgi:hypothetical protein
LEANGDIARERFGPSRWTLLHYAVKVLRSADPAGQAECTRVCGICLANIEIDRDFQQQDIRRHWMSMDHGFPIKEKWELNDKHWD